MSGFNVHYTKNGQSVSIFAADASSAKKLMSAALKDTGVSGIGVKPAELQAPKFSLGQEFYSTASYGVPLTIKSVEKEDDDWSYTVFLEGKFYQIRTEQMLMDSLIPFVKDDEIDEQMIVCPSSIPSAAVFIYNRLAFDVYFQSEEEGCLIKNSIHNPSDLIASFGHHKIARLMETVKVEADRILSAKGTVNYVKRKPYCVAVEMEVA